MRFGVREICDVVFKAKSTIRLGDANSKYVLSQDNLYYILIQLKLLQWKKLLQQYMLRVVKVIQT